jgi:hypothetical protein
VKGFQNWKKVDDGRECALIKHMGDASSTHNYSVRCLTNLKNTMVRIENKIRNQKREWLHQED